MWQAENMEDYWAEIQHREHVSDLTDGVIENYFDGNYTKQQAARKIAEILEMNGQARSNNHEKSNQNWR